MFPSQVHRNIYLVLLALLGGSMVTSVWLSNLVWILMGLNWLLEGRWREKWQMACESRLLQAYTVLYLLLLMGMLWTSNTNHGFSVLQVKMPLFFVPLVMLTTRPVTGRARRFILWFYATAVLVVSIIGTVRLLTIPDLPYRDAVPYISHIRFSLNCCMVIFLACSEMRHATIGLRVMLALLTLWLLTFVVMMHSYTAISVLAVVSLAVLLLRHRRWQLLVLWFALVGGLAAIVGYEVKSYYTLCPLAREPLHPFTANGRPYDHARDGVIECGNYINNYVCREELHDEWQRRSTLPYNGLTESGYSVESTLIRYLNALSLTKDSVGVATLTAQQVHDVERGVANPVYESRNPLRKMVYVLLLEREFHLHYNAVWGFSMLQRFELWDAALQVVQRHPWVGVGTGDVDDELHNQLFQQHSHLAGTQKSTHNQYLSFLTAFGIIGAVVLVFFFLRAATRLRRQPTLLLAWTFIILISCLTEDTLDTLAGILFSTWFLAHRNNQTQ